MSTSQTSNLDFSNIDDSIINSSEQDNTNNQSLSTQKFLEELLNESRQGTLNPNILISIGHLHIQHIFEKNNSPFAKLYRWIHDHENEDACDLHISPRQHLHYLLLGKYVSDLISNDTTKYIDEKITNLNNKH